MLYTIAIKSKGWNTYNALYEQRTTALFKGYPIIRWRQIGNDTSQWWQEAQSDIKKEDGYDQLS